MENASKALLIAAAVLIVITLIGFGISVLNSGSEAIKQGENVGNSISLSGKDAVDKVGSILDRLGGGSVSLDHSGVVPVGGEYNSGGTTYEPGDTIPTLQNGDIYDYGDYKYTYSSGYNYWTMSVKDKTKSKYGKTLHKINGKDIGSISFNGCGNMTNSPELPPTIKTLNVAFSGCEKLEEMPEIPETTWQMTYAFNGCKSMKTVKDIPDKVQTLTGCFGGCSSITSITIPKNVTYVTQAFTGCTNLTNITIKKSEGSLNLSSSGLTTSQINSVVWDP